MLGAFSFLGKEKAKEIVVQNTQQLANEIEDISPIQDGLFTPNIEGAEQEMRDLCYSMAKRVYGEPIPEIVTSRLEKELEVLSEMDLPLFI